MLVPLANIVSMGETITSPKPRGIVLRPLTMTQPPVAPTPNPVATPAATATDARRPATIPPEILREALAASLAEALFLEREDSRAGQAVHRHGAGFDRGGGVGAGAQHPLWHQYHSEPGV